MGKVRTRGVVNGYGRASLRREKNRTAMEVLSIVRYGADELRKSKAKNGNDRNGNAKEWKRDEWTRSATVRQCSETWGGV